MKENGRAIFTVIHTWAGLLTGWLLFVIFFAGTLSVFAREISLWMRPEIPPPTPITEMQAYEKSLTFLDKYQPDAKFWVITPPTEREPFVTLAWSNEKTRWHKTVFNPETGEEMQPRKTEGGEFFTEFHHELHYIPHRLAFWLLFILSSVAITAMVAGVIIHKRIFIDFFTFRFKKGLKSWLDAHNLFSVLPLPFHFMIIYSGAMILGLHGVMDYNIQKSFKSHNAFYQPIFAFERPLEEAGTVQKMPDLLPLLIKAKQDWDKESLGSITINNPNREQASLVLTDENPRLLTGTREMRTYRIADGSLLRKRAEGGLFQTLLSGTFRMHLASFANLSLQWLYFICGLAGSAMIATGSIMWIVKRQDRKNPPLQGIWWVERLNFAVFAGFPLGCIAYFHANRLLPTSLAERAEWEIHSIFITWLLIILCTFNKRSDLRHILQKSLKIGAVALFALPLLDIFAGRPFWFNLWHWDTLFLGIETCFIVVGIIFWHFANYVKIKGV